MNTIMKKEALEKLLTKSEEILDQLKDSAVESLQIGDINTATQVASLSKLAQNLNISLKNHYRVIMQDQQKQHDKVTPQLNNSYFKSDSLQVQSVNIEKGMRAERGERTTEEDFKPFILQALIESGGSGKTSDIVNKARSEMERKKILQPVDYEPLPKTGHSRWYITACYARKHMIREKLLSSTSPNGIWEITDNGRKYINNKLRNPQ